MSTGKFCWFDLMTTDVAAARAFHAALFGWEIRDHADAYKMISDPDGRSIGGIMAAPPGTSSLWLPYVTTDDVAATAARARALGGQVFVEHEAAGVGRFAIFADPQGAVSAAIQLERDLGPYPRDKGRSHLGWSELHTPDPEASVAFYADLFGWTFDAYGPDYFMLTTEHAGGIARQRAAGAPPYWLVYANVASLGASVAKAAELGARVTVPPTPMPPTGTYAVFTDPTGAVMAMIETAAK